MKKSVLREYARLIVRAGVNVQKGQEVLVYAELEQPEFVAMVVDEAYKAKAKTVKVFWDYAPLTKLKARYESLSYLSKVEEWELARQEHYCQAVPCRIHLVSEDPDGLKGVNLKKLSQARQNTYPVLKPYRDRLENKQQWCIAAVPGVAWARKLFPKLSKNQAVEKLWEQILLASRVCGDSVEAWNAHSRDLKKRCQYLNDLHITSLHYTAANGTDLTVGMIPQAVFCGGDETASTGIVFNPNIPTEECFISPMKGQAEGIVYATKPLSYNSQLIEDFYFRFEGGKVVEAHANVVDEALQTMLSMDEGASYLGECALVPQSSPISRSGLLFYNTLFDENAACHLALGMGFADTIRDFHNKTLEECRALGINDSMIHVDFMIGCDTMNIDAVTESGKTVAIFRNGNWAF